jgi:hypothetical protein
MQVSSRRRSITAIRLHHARRHEGPGACDAPVAKREGLLHLIVRTFLTALAIGLLHVSTGRVNDQLFA